MIRTLLLACTLCLPLLAGCTSPPPNLSPEARTAYHATRVIRSLDLARDIAIAAHDQTPPLLSEATTRKVVLFHKSAITIAHEAPAGWRAAIQTSLTELIAALEGSERTQLLPYLILTQTLLQELSQ